MALRSKPGLVPLLPLLLLLACILGATGVDAACKKSAAKRPVCGVDKKTYANTQAAACAKVKVLHPGPCPVCPRHKACAKAARLPVCGADSRTYCSACVAKLLKVKATKGPCMPPRPACNQQGTTCKPSAARACCPGLTCAGNDQVSICTATGTGPGGLPAGGGPGGPGGPGGLPGGGPGGPGGLPGGGPGGLPSGGPGSVPGSGGGGGGGGIGGIGGLG